MCVSVPTHYAIHSSKHDPRSYLVSDLTRHHRRLRPLFASGPAPLHKAIRQSTLGEH